MGWVKTLQGQVVALDSAPLIYFIEQRQPYVDLLRPFFRGVEAGELSIVTSVVTLLEVMVQPIRYGDEALANEYQEILLNGANVQTVSVTPTVAQVAAELRAESRLKTPDAIHLATALQHQAAAFLTNDRDFGSAVSLPIFRIGDLVE